jgi:hypothetical protein
MRPLDGDAALLLRAGERCTALALDLGRLEKALGGAADSTAARWSGTAAAAFGAMANAHRGTVQHARGTLEQLGMMTSRFARELGDAQLAAKRLPDEASAERKAIEDRISLLRKRFHQQSMRLESEMKQLLLRRPVDPPRWTGPVRPPGGWRGSWPFEPPPLSGPVNRPGPPPRVWPFEPPPLSGPVNRPGPPPRVWPYDPPPLSGPPGSRRWKGPIRPPVQPRQPLTSIRPVGVVA